jgi:hypothetical protein
MALRISVDLDGLRWADLFRFVDLARSGGVGPDDQVDVISYGSDSLATSLSARIYPSAEGLLAAAGAFDSSASNPPPSQVEPPTRDSGLPSPPPLSSNGQHFAPFEPTFERSSASKSRGEGLGQPPHVESPYVDEFTRLQEGLMRPVRRVEDAGSDRG